MQGCRQLNWCCRSCFLCSLTDFQSEGVRHRRRQKRFRPSSWPPIFRSQHRILVGALERGGAPLRLTLLSFWKGSIAKTKKQITWSKYNTIRIAYIHTANQPTNQPTVSVIYSHADSFLRIIYLQKRMPFNFWPTNYCFCHRVPPLTLSLAISMRRPSIFPWISLWSVLRTRNRLRWALARYTSMSPRGYPSRSTSGVSSPIGWTPSEGGVVSSDNIASASSSIDFRWTSNDASVLRSVVSPSPSLFLSPGIFYCLVFVLVACFYELLSMCQGCRNIGFAKNRSWQKSSDFSRKVIQWHWCCVQHDSVRDPSLSIVVDHKKSSQNPTTTVECTIRYQNKSIRLIMVAYVRLNYSSDSGVN